MLNANQDLAAQSDSFRQFEGGVKLGIGSFNLVSCFKADALIGSPPRPTQEEFKWNINCLLLIIESVHLVWVDTVTALWTGLGVISISVNHTYKLSLSDAV